MMCRRLRFFLPAGLVVAWILTLSALAQTPPVSGGVAVMKVGVYSSPPFAMTNAVGQWEGLSVELWDMMAQDLKIQYQLVPQTRVDIVRGLRDHRLDVGLGRFVPNAEDEVVVDFTHAYYFSGVGMAIRDVAEMHHWMTVANLLTSPQVLHMLALVLGTLLISGAGMWWLERKRNPDHFGGGVLHGIGTGIWWSAATMTTVGYGDKVPRTPSGRVMALVWMLIGIVVIAAFTSTMTSVLTASRLDTHIDGARDLRHMKVTTLENSMGAAYLRAHHLWFDAVDSVDSALSRLNSGQTEVVVYDIPELKYHAIRPPFLALQVLPHNLCQQGYVIMLQDKSPFIAVLDETLLRLTVTSAWQDIMMKYTGGE